MRRRLRDAARDAITGAATLAGNAVFCTRDLPVPRGSQPAVLIYTPHEESHEAALTGPPRFTMRTILILECITQNAGLRTAEQQLETLCEQVVNALLTNPAFVGLADEDGNRLIEGFPSLETMEKFDASGDRHVGEAHIALRVQYSDVYEPTLTTALAGVNLTSLADGATVPITWPQKQPGAAPLVGAFRWDGFYQPGGAINAMVAAQLGAFPARLPFFAAAGAGAGALWPQGTQAGMDAEIAAAARAGLGFWAFAGFDPASELMAAYALYQTSALKPWVAFCLTGQPAAWSATPSAAQWRDVGAFADPAYVSVLGGRPLYPVQAGGTNAAMAAGIAFARSASAAQGTGNPYVVLLSPSPLALFDNVALAQQVGADAAASYAPAVSRSGAQYAQLASDAAADWSARASAGFPMAPTAMAGWDPTPAAVLPEPYALPSGGNGAVYAAGTPGQIAAHAAAMLAFLAANQAACPANVGFITAWNDAVEGAAIWPGFIAGNQAGDPAIVAALARTLAPPPL